MYKTTITVRCQIDAVSLFWCDAEGEVFGFSRDPMLDDRTPEGESQLRIVFEDPEGLLGVLSGELDAAVRLLRAHGIMIEVPQGIGRLPSPPEELERYLARPSTPDEAAPVPTTRW